MLAKASIALAQLRNLQVVELLATVIANLVEGEMMQMKVDANSLFNFDYYIEKTYTYLLNFTFDFVEKEKKRNEFFFKKFV